MSGTIFGTIKLEDIRLNALLEFDGTTTDFRVIASLTGGPYSLGPLLDKFHLPSSYLEQIQLSSLMLSADIVQKVVSFDVGLADVLQFGTPKTGFVLDDVEMGFTYKAGPNSRCSGFISAVATIVGYSVQLRADYTGANAGWQFTGSLLPSSPGLPLVKLASDIGSQFGLSGLDRALPAVITDLSLNFLQVAFNTHTKNFSFNGLASFDKFEPKTKPPMVINLNLTRTSTGSYSKYFSGQLSLGGLVFNLLFDTTGSRGTSSTLVGVFANQQGTSISLSNLISAISADAATVLQDHASLTFTIKNAVFAYTSTAQGASGTAKQQYLFAVDMNTGFDFSGLGNLPLIGHVMPQHEGLSLAFQLMVSSQPWTAGTLQGLLAGVPPNFSNDINQGVSFLTTLRMGNQSQFVDLGIDDGSINNGLGDPTLQNSTAVNPAASFGASSSTAPAIWINLQKKLRPLAISAPRADVPKWRHQCPARCLDRGRATQHCVRGPRCGL